MSSKIAVKLCYETAVQKQCFTLHSVSLTGCLVALVLLCHGQCTWSCCGNTECLTLPVPLPSTVHPFTQSTV